MEEREPGKARGEGEQGGHPEPLIRLLVLAAKKVRRSCWPMSCASQGPSRGDIWGSQAGPVCAREVAANTTRTESPGGETEAAAMATVMTVTKGRCGPCQVIWLVPMPTIKAQCLVEDGVLCAEGHLMIDPWQKATTIRNQPKKRVQEWAEEFFMGAGADSGLRAGCLRRKGRGQGERSEKTFMLRTRGSCPNEGDDYVWNNL